MHKPWADLESEESGCAGATRACPKIVSAYFGQIRGLLKEFTKIKSEAPSTSPGSSTISKAGNSPRTILKGFFSVKTVYSLRVYLRLKLFI